MERKNKRVVIALATAGVAAAGVASLAGAAEPTTTRAAGPAVVRQVADATPTPSQGDFEGCGPRADRTPLTGEVAAKVKAAAEKAVPGGTYVVGHKDPEGTYGAAVRKSDGTMVRVRLSATFAVTDTEVMPAPGMGRGPGGDHTPLASDVAAKVEAAAEKAVSGGTYLDGHKESDGTYDALVRKSDGTMVRVRMTSAFKVTGTESAPAPGMGHGGPGMGRGGRGMGGDGRGPAAATPSTSGTAATTSATATDA